MDVFGGSGEFTIENEVLFGPYCVIVSTNHSLLNESYRYGPPIFKPTIIKKGAWVGAHVSVLAGTTIEQGALVGANSLVSKVVSKLSIVGGVPAKIIAKN
jgi:acetyltransferase-like isoleucine patch superfamily enzyme